VISDDKKEEGWSNLWSIGHNKNPSATSNA
jgi:hypothetical protein